MNVKQGDARCPRAPDDRAQPQPRSNLDAARRKLHANGGLALQGKLVAGEPAQQVGLADTAVSDQHDLEQVIVAGRGNEQSGEATNSDQATAGRRLRDDCTSDHSSRPYSLVIWLGNHHGSDTAGRAGWQGRGEVWGSLRTDWALRYVNTSPTCKLITS